MRPPLIEGMTPDEQKAQFDMAAAHRAVLEAIRSSNVAGYGSEILRALQDASDSIGYASRVARGET
jgi:hypothetical protein